MLLSATSAAAHANLVRSNPSASAALAQSPDEIRLWFSESLEAGFSTLTLRDADGNVIETSPAEIDANDAMQLVLIPGDLPDGLYTVTWRVVSSTDGHLTRGSFAFAVGESAAQLMQANEFTESVPINSALIRAFNLLSMGLAVGSIGFWLFVWQPAVPGGNPALEKRMRRLIWAGWFMLGGMLILVVLLQVSIVSDVSLRLAITHPVLEQVILDTRFGTLWQIRVVLWALLGQVLYFAGQDHRLYRVALALGAGLLFAHSLFSHASGVSDISAAVAGDWLHMLAMAAWFGGLAQFINLINPVRRTLSTEVLSRLVGHFSNYARAAVVMLILSGVYAAWLHVGNIDSLLTTAYGQALLAKLILAMPLLGTAGINLLFTRRRLQMGHAVWGGYLRILVGVEIVLVIGILGMVGIMTAIAPARTTIAARESFPEAPDPIPITLNQTQNNLQIDLEISPGWTGDNTFMLRLRDSAHNSIDDASRIRMRFTHAETAESELQPEHQGDGIYTAGGANLSLAGDWRIRVTIQRPGEYDTVVDFNPLLESPPQPDPVPPPDPAPAEAMRMWALLLTGMAALVTGGLTVQRRELRAGSSLMAMLGMVIGLVFLVNGLSLSRQSVTAQYQPDPDAPVRAAVSRSSDLPLLLTENGTLLNPDDDGIWEPIPFEGSIRDVYMDLSGAIWAAADTGLYIHDGGSWSLVSEEPAARLTETHGYIYALGEGEIARLPGIRGQEDVKLLSAPHQDQPASEFVMLGTHSHVLQNGNAVFLSPDLGLSWHPLDAPAPIRYISTDFDGYLLAVTAEGILRWNSSGWVYVLPLPEGSSVDTMTLHNKTLYAIAGGNLYRQVGRDWEAVQLPDSDDAYLTSITLKYPDTLYVVDAKGARLWVTRDGQNWVQHEIKIRIP